MPGEDEGNVKKDLFLPAFCWEVFFVGDVKPIVRIPTSPNRVREGRGFSLGEIIEANLTLHDVKRIGLRVDLRRRSVHKENVEALKAMFGNLKKAEKKEAKVREAKKEKKVKEVEEGAGVKVGTPLTVLKGLGSKTAEKLKEVGIESVEDLAEEDAEALSKATGISASKLASWIDEAKKMKK